MAQYSATDLGTLGGSSSTAADINEAGQVVGYSTAANGLSHAFLWDSGAMIDLGTLGGTRSSAAAINDLGQIVGSAAIPNGVDHAFVITPQGGTWFRDSNLDGRNDLMIDLGIVSRDISSWASDINNSGQIVGGYTLISDWSDYGYSNQAFVWDSAHGMTNLGPVGFTDTFASGINEAGQPIIVSQGIGTILDDEPRISIGDVSKAEGKKNQSTLFTFTVTLSASYDQAVTMSFRTVNGTATTNDQDYLAKTGTLTFALGETSKTITIEVRGDNKKETNETFYLDFFSNSSNSLFTKNRGLGTILNDD